MSYIFETCQILNDCSTTTIAYSLKKVVLIRSEKPQVKLYWVELLPYEQRSNQFR